jgi:RND superfamily putative drug exporter
VLDRIARVSHAHPIRVLIIALLVAGTALGVGLGLVGGLSASGFNDPGSNSVRAQEEIVAATGASAVPSVVALVEPGGPVASPDGTALVQRVERVMREDPDVVNVVGPSPQSPQMTSKDGTKARVLAYFGDINEDQSQVAAASTTS